MKVEQDRNVSRQSGMLETADFTINLDGMMFNNLINGMYSDKIAAPIREISTNARDGHAAVGLLDTPFDVCLPSVMKPVFSVRDFGCSLTHDEIMNMYSVLGKSTKRETDELTGCLGLGSKSPFAYTNSFNVTCWKDNEMRVYSAYISTGGQPSISLVSSEPSNEPTGVLVSIAVKSSDISSFNRTANKVFVGFNPRPNVTNSNGDYQKEEKEILYEGTGWKMYNDIDRWNTKNSYAVQGSVSYPINIENSDLRRAMSEQGNKVNSNDRYGYRSANTVEEQLLKNCPMVITFDIGDLSTTTSREDLAYDKKTCKSIVDRLSAIAKEIKIQVNTKYESADTQRAARLLLSKDVDENRISGMLQTIGIDVEELSWKGQKIAPKINIYNCSNTLVKHNKGNRYDQKFSDQEIKDGQITLGVTVLDAYRFKNKNGFMKASFKWSDSTRVENVIHGSYHKFHENDQILIQCMDSVNKSDNNKLRNFWKNKASSVNYWFKVKNAAQATELINFLECKKENVHYLNDFQDLKMPSKAKPTGTVVAKTKDTFRQIVARRWGNSGTSFIDIPLTDKEKRITFYQKGDLFYMSEADMDKEYGGRKESRLQEKMYAWTAALSISPKHPIILNTRNIGLKKTRNIFIDAQDWIEDELNKKVSDIDKLLLDEQNYKLAQEDPEFFAVMHRCKTSHLPHNISSMMNVRRNILNTKVKDDLMIITLYEQVFEEKIKTARTNLEQKQKLDLNVKRLLANDPILNTLTIAAAERYGYSFDKATTLEALNQYLLMIKMKRNNK